MNALDISFNIADVIENESIVTYFQPITSIKRREIIGYEALTRGVVKNESGEDVVLSPGVLFRKANEAGLVLEFDRLCRKKAAKSFSAVREYDQDAMLFVNFDASLIENHNIDIKRALSLVYEAGMKPHNVVVELIESKVRDVNVIKDFSRTCRDAGFVLAVDDIGAGHSNMDRVALIKPDIIKIDRYLISGVDHEYHKQEVIKSLVGLAQKIGSVVVAEGVETEAEALVSLELGADLLQGYYVARPSDISRTDPEDAALKVNVLAESLRAHLKKRHKEELAHKKHCSSIISALTSKISGAEVSQFDNSLSDISKNYEGVEFIYILNEHGVQVSETVGGEEATTLEYNKLFSPAKKGSDQSLKEYYRSLSDEMSMYFSEPYISLASGKVCKTLSARFNDKKDTPYILCVDINPNAFRGEN